MLSTFYFTNKLVIPIEIHMRMNVQYGDACLLIHQMYEGSRKFENGLSSLTACSRSGQAQRVVTSMSIAAVARLVYEHTRLTHRHILA